MVALLKKAAGWIVTIAFLVWLINNIDQAIDIITKAVMFVVGIFEKIGDAVSEGIDSADSATAIHDAVDAVTQIARAVLGG